MAQHAFAAADDGHGPSPGDADDAADGALLRAVPGRRRRRRRQAAAAAQVDIELVSARRTTNLYCSLYRTVMLLMLKSTKKKKKRKGIHATTVFNLATPEKDSAAGDELRGLSCN